MFCIFCILYPLPGRICQVTNLYCSTLFPCGCTHCSWGWKDCLRTSDHWCCLPVSSWSLKLLQTLQYDTGGNHQELSWGCHTHTAGSWAATSLIMNIQDCHHKWMIWNNSKTPICFESMCFHAVSEWIHSEPELIHSVLCSGMNSFLIEFLIVSSVYFLLFWQRGTIRSNIKHHQNEVNYLSSGLFESVAMESLAISSRTWV